jgi:hypothetical protein
MWKINEVRSKNVLEKRKSYIISCGRKKVSKLMIYTNRKIKMIENTMICLMLNKNQMRIDCLLGVQPKLELVQ